MGQLQKIEAKLIEIGFQIVAITPDLPGKLPATADKNKLKYQLVSDSAMAGAMAFGIAYRMSDHVFAQAPRYKTLLEEASGQQHHLLPVPAVFLVGTDARISFQYVNPDYHVRLDPDVLLAAAKAHFKKP